MSLLPQTPLNTIENDFIRRSGTKRLSRLKLKWSLSKLSDFPGQDHADEYEKNRDLSYNHSIKIDLASLVKYAKQEQKLALLIVSLAPVINGQYPNISINFDINELQSLAKEIILKEEIICKNDIANNKKTIRTEDQGLSELNKFQQHVLRDIASTQLTTRKRTRVESSQNSQSFFAIKNDQDKEGKEEKTASFDDRDEWKFQ